MKVRGKQPYISRIFPDLKVCFIRQITREARDIKIEKEIKGGRGQEMRSVSSKLFYKQIFGYVITLLSSLS